MNFSALPEIATGLGGASIGGLITGVFGHRKNRADAAAILTTTAMSLVQPLSQQVDAMRVELDAVRTELAAHKQATERREATRKLAMVAHTEWDTQMAGRLRDAGFDVPAPPPLDAA